VTTQTTRCTLVALALCGTFVGAQKPDRIVGLDHIPIAVADLERAAERYRALGFTLKPGRPHENGLRNEHAKFQDGTELELITAPEATDALTTRYRRHLASGDGPAFLAFFVRSRDRMPPRDAALPDIFFGQRNYSPTDRPEHFEHPNTAQSLIGVWLAADDLSAERRLLENSGAAIARRTVHAPDETAADVAQFQDGDVVLLPAKHQTVAGRRIVGATVRVKSLATARRLLERTDASALRSVSTATYASVFLPPAMTHGLWLELREDRSGRAGASGRDWRTYNGDVANSHYSTLDQIRRDNVGRLQVAWKYDTGDKGEFQANNLIVDGVLYTASPSRKVIALDAATGKEIWTFDPRKERDAIPGYRHRGVMYWESGDDRRIFTSAGTWLYALDARTGRVVRGFGEKGSIHLGVGMGLSETPTTRMTTPGVIYNDMLITGGLVSESTAGAVRAFDVRTGKLRWAFRTIPRPGEEGHETWPPDAWKTAGGASDWSGHAIDEGRGILYISTESAGPDFWGGDRYGMNLFANSLVALDANTGRRLWHFQMVHHDLWDLDLPSPPTLLTVTHKGKRIDAVAQGTKMGLLFVFDRVSGRPLWPIRERPAPPSKIPGIRTWPTQPVPDKPPPLMRQIYTSKDVSNISPDAQALTSERRARADAFGAFPSPSLKETIMFPGFDGGFEWGGAAADPNGILYANINEMPWLYQLIPTRGTDGTALTRGERQYRIYCGSCHGPDRAGDPRGGMPPLLDPKPRLAREYVMQIMEQGGGRMPAFNQVPEERRRAIVDFLFGTEKEGPSRDSDEDAGEPPYVFGGFRRWLDREGYPAIKPPWGTLNAVDLNTGRIKWKVPLGEYPELTTRRIPTTGTENYGGPVVTAGGLVFIGATADETFRAFDKDTGKILWQARLPFSGNATPSTYTVNGKQYVVISAGGAKSNRPAGGAVVAFALPE